MFRKFEGYTILNDGTIFNQYGEVLKPYKVKSRSNTYLKIDLYSEKWLNIRTGRKRKKFLVHRLVAFLFFEGYENYLFSKFEVDHKNRNTCDNRLENLEIVTPSENCKRWRKVKKYKH